jgi:hypothetical protein
MPNFKITVICEIRGLKNGENDSSLTPPQAD